MKYGDSETTRTHSHSCSYPGNSQIPMSSRSQATTVWIGTAVQAETSLGGAGGPSPPMKKKKRKKR